jgi:hypothetical protein
VYSGFPCDNNDVNVLYHSYLVVDLLQGLGNNLGFVVNAYHYDQCYFLVNKDKIMVVDHHSNSCMSCKKNVCNTLQVHKRLCTKTPNMDLEFCKFGSKFLQIHVANGTTRL